jgi:hypothetical protein
MPTNTYVALRTEVLTSAVPSVTFNLSGITGYTDLVMIMNGSLTGNGAVYCEFNGDTGSNYSSTYIQGQSGSASSGRDTRLFLFGFLNSGSGPNVGIANFQSYANSTTFKTVLSRANDAFTVNANVGLWRNTAAITSIALKTSANNFATGTTFTIYGIANADNFAKATGGIIREDATYWYHVFGANGTFTPKQSLSCDVLVVAGGGAGGNNAGGGGGAGGFLYFGSQSLASGTNYSCTVGAGGAGNSQSGGGAAAGANGVNSQFAALTVTVGGGGGAAYNGTLGANGGSGGGGSENFGTGAGGIGTAGQGNNGGARSTLLTYAAGGGGGGATAAGGTGSGSTAGAGGNGVSTYSDWVAATGIGANGGFAGGGGGAGDARGPSNGGAGGTGGGGAGANNGSATNGLIYSGSGGGGAPYTAGTRSSGNGGSGIVIVRYLKA